MEKVSIITMKSLILALSSLFFLSPIFAQEQTHMTIQLTDDGSAHIVLESKTQPKIDELRSIINKPSIKTIYTEKLSSVFKNLENLNIQIEQQ